VSAPVGSPAFGKWYARADRRCANSGYGAFRTARIPIHTPAVAPTDNGLLAPELAAGIARVKSAKSIGVGSGVWLTLRQAQALLNAPDITKTKGLRASAIIAPCRPAAPCALPHWWRPTMGAFQEHSRGRRRSPRGTRMRRSCG
jgi:hypothetical protein